MKLRVGTAAVCLGLLAWAATTPAKERQARPGPLSGTWECTSHGGSEGDMPFTLLLEQRGKTVTGSVCSPIGSTQITSASFQDKTLSIKIDAGQNTYLLTAKLKNGKLTGKWSNQSEKGTWEGTKHDEMSP